METLNDANSLMMHGPPPGGPTIQIDWPFEQARSLRYLPLFLVSSVNLLFIMRL